jgi:trehalose synthase
VSSALQHVAIAPMDPRRFSAVLSAGEYEALLDTISHGVRELRGRVIWNVNSTARGGGVAELLTPLLGYCRGAGVDARWAVITAGPEFFQITKRIHNRLHGFAGDGGPLGERERATYERALRPNAAELVDLVHSDDVVILHDPQTAGLARAVRRTGAHLIWRCHVGLDHANDHAREAWSFLRPHVLEADMFVFSRAAFAWEGLPRDRISVIRPSIDAFAPKNAEQTAEQTLAILAGTGIVSPNGSVRPTFTRSDGTLGRVERQATMVQEEPIALQDGVVLQVSRWDRLKDPLGVLGAFVEHVSETNPARLLLAGPSTEAVADDPEGAEVHAEVREAWSVLPAHVRRRVHLASLPMEDVEENAAMVNALQRTADVVLQKSLAEGFGLTVSEAMWKRRPVVASRIGGIRDQIEHGRSGVLLSDPHDLREAGRAVAALLADKSRARQMGAAAREHVQQHFLGPHQLGRYFEVIRRLIAHHPLPEHLREEPSGVDSTGADSTGVDSTATD